MRIKTNSSFFKSILVLSSGSIMAQLITVIVSPVLTRLYNPLTMGVYTYILSISSLFMPVINGRYDVAIVTENEEENIYPIIKLSLIIGSILSLLISVSFYIYSKMTSNQLTNTFLISFMLFIILISYSIINLLNAYNSRNKEFGLISSVHILRTFTQNVGSAGAGLLNLGIYGLLTPYLLGQLLSIKKQANHLKIDYKRILEVKLKKIKEVSKKHFNLPLYSAPALMVNGFSYSAIVFFIEALYGMSLVGIYSISVRILGLPLSIISGNVSKVFFQEASREFEKEGNFTESFNKTVKLLFLMTIPLFVGMYFIVPHLIGIVFGSQWEQAGSYIRILAFMYSIRFVVSTVSPGMIVANAQKSELKLQVPFIISSVFCFLISKIFLFDIYGFLHLINITYSLSFLAYFFKIFKLSKK